MMHLDYIEMESFRSFVRPTRINFARKGLYHLKGVNLETGGSSGSGKSSVGLGVNFVFGTCPIPSTELKSWDAKTPATVKLGLDGPEKVCVKRGKKFEVTVGAKESEGSVAQKEDEVVKVFGGLSMEMVQALTYRGQRQPGLFLSKTDSEKKSFLTKVIGLEPVEAEVKESAKKVTALEQKLYGLGLQLSEREMQIETLEPDADAREVLTLAEQMQARIDARTSKIAELANQRSVVNASTEEAAEAEELQHQPALARAKAHLEGLRTAVGAPHDDDPAVLQEIARLTETANQCAARSTKLVYEDGVRRRDLDAKRSECNTRLQALNLRAGTAYSLAKSQERLKTELAQMEVDICPTCEREWDKAEAHRAHLNAKLVEVEAQIATFNETLEQIEALALEVAQLPRFEPNPTIARLQELGAKTKALLAGEEQKLANAAQIQVSERRRVLAEASEAMAKIVTAKNEAVAKIRDVSRVQLRDLEIEAEQERRLLNKDRDGLKELQVQLGRLQSQAEQIIKLHRELVSIRGEYDIVDAALKAERDFAALIGREGFLGSIFDEVLQQISDETNAVLGSVANTRHVTLQFRSENVTQKGTVEREIRPIVTVNGHETSVRGGLSGGMLSTLELAVDLAVGKVVSERSGVCPGWLILDESFDGLDTVSKETCIEILQKFAHDRLVLVVDHASEMQGMFTNVITVTYKDGVSTVT